MKYKLIIFWIFVFMLAQGVQTIHAQDEFPKKFFKKNITRFEITGNVQAEELKQLSELPFKTQVGSRTTPEQLSKDLELIYSQGFLKSISVSSFMTSRNRELIIHVTPNSRINQITFQGLSSIDAAKLLSKTQLKLDSRLDYRLLKRDIEQMNQLFQEEGFQLSFVAKAEFIESSQTLVYNVAEIRVRNITIQGNEHNHSDYYLRELWVKPGEVYNLYRLRRDRFNLLKLGFVRFVSEPQVIPLAQPDQIDVVFQVQEQKSNSTQFGLGYTNIKNKRFVFANFNLLNLLGWGESMQIKTQLGLESADTEDKQTFSYRYRFSNMIDPGSKLIGAFEIFSETSAENLRQGGNIVSSNVLIKRSGFLLETQLPFSEKTRWTSRIRFSEVREEENQVVNYQKNSWINIIRFENIKQDRYRNPFSGVVGVARLEKSFGAIFDDNTLPYEQYDLATTFYTPLWSEQDVMVFNLALGQISFPTNEIITEGELYSMGGPSTVRGYSPNNPFATGKKKFQFNLEYRHVFSELLTGVLFYDYGGAYDEDLFSNFNVLLGEGFRYSFGAGLRFNTPIGAVQTDLAQNQEGYHLIHITIGATF